MDAEQTAHNRRVMDALTRMETAQTTGFARTETTLQAIVKILEEHGDQFARLTPPAKRGHRPTAAAR